MQVADRIIVCFLVNLSKNSNFGFRKVKKIVIPAEICYVTVAYRDIVMVWESNRTCMNMTD